MYVFFVVFFFFAGDLHFTFLLLLMTEVDYDIHSVASVV